MITKDEVASWEFQGTGIPYTIDELNSLSRKSLLEKFSENFNQIEIILNELRIGKLFSPTQLCFPDKYIDLIEENQPNEIIKLISSHIIESQNCEKVFWLVGKSKIESKGNSIISHGTFTILLELWSNLITLSTYNDCWLPISLLSDYWTTADSGNIYTKDAEINSRRLEISLQKIKEKGNFIKIYPDSDEISDDYRVIQKGFRMYYHKSTREMITKEHAKLELMKFFMN